MGAFKTKLGLVPSWVSFKNAASYNKQVTIVLHLGVANYTTEY